MTDSVHNDTSPNGEAVPAPQLRDRWESRFALQLTHQGLGPDAIARAIAEVRSHCADSGQSPREAFGDPASYATTLAAELPRPTPRPVLTWRRFVALLVTALGAAAECVTFFAPGTSTASITVGHILIATVAVPVWIVATSPLIPPRPRDPRTPDRPAWDEKGFRTIWVMLALLAVSAPLWLLLDEPVLTLPQGVLRNGGLACVVAGLILNWLFVSRATRARPTRR